MALNLMVTIEEYCQGSDNQNADGLSQQAHKTLTVRGIKRGVWPSPCNVTPREYGGWDNIILHFLRLDSGCPRLASQGRKLLRLIGNIRTRVFSMLNDTKPQR